ncbi:MAG: nucleotidyltransferase domain-containing protein [Bacteroidetes bacterium]|nr:nucleotidyltransferase domain-containing protein [Bacteroidota bacterium]
MYSQSDINNIVSKFISLVSDEFPIKYVYLFGSYARGNAREYSDVDLAVVSDKFEGSRFFDKKKLNKYILQTSTDLEVHPFKTVDFTEDNPFVKEIIQTGLKII